MYVVIVIVIVIVDGFVDCGIVHARQLDVLADKSWEHHKHVHGCAHADTRAHMIQLNGVHIAGVMIYTRAY